MWELWWTWVVALEVAWVVILSVYILFEGRTPQATIAWILALSFLPIVGVAVYFLVGPRRFDRRKVRRARARAAVKRGVQARTGDAADHDYRDDVLHLMHLCETVAGPSARPRTAEVTVYTDGAEKFRAIHEAIAEAEHHVHLEYYIWDRGEVGTKLRDVLVAAAKRDVEVRVLVDSFGASKATRQFFQPLVDAGGIVHRFNELKLSRWRPRMANFRTHRKIVVCDGSVGFVGGMNVSDVHDSEATGAETWRDTHLRLRGPAVRGLQMVFCEDWHYATGRAPEGPDYFPKPLPPGDKLIQIVSSGPDENMDAIHKLFFSSIATAHNRVLLTTPYFVPDEATLQALASASLRGADVEVLVPSSGDVPLVAAAARSYYPTLLQSGARIYELDEPVLHAKTLVVDDEVAVVGTANFDNRSFRLNFEVVAAVYHPSLCKTLVGHFDQDVSNATEVTQESLDQLGFGQRLFSATARLLSPIL